MGDEKKRMLKVMNDLKKRPLSLFFNQIPVVHKDVERDYFDIIKNPICIDMVIDNINKNKYVNAAHWIEDVERIWSNCELYHGRATYYGYCARYLRHQFFKLAKSFFTFMPSGFAEELYRLRTKLGDIIDRAPSEQNSDSYTSYKSFDEFTLKHLPDEEELNKLINEVDSSSSPDEHKEIKNILYKLQPELSEIPIEKGFDVTLLKPDTFYAVMDFLQR